MFVENLYQQYPDLLSDHPDISVGVGWQNIVEKLMFDVNQVVQSHAIKLHVSQIKSKFASLRFYYHTLNCQEEVSKKIKSLVEDAVNLASKTCEICGKQASDILEYRRNKSGWLYVECDSCWSERT